MQRHCVLTFTQEFLPWVEDSRVLSTLTPGTGSPAKGIVARASGEGNISAALLDSSSQICELRVGFGPFTERLVHVPCCPLHVRACIDCRLRYTSRVTVSHMPDGSTVVKATAGDRFSHTPSLCPPPVLSLTRSSSVFSMLVNEWSIQPSARPGSSIVKFYVTFKFKRCQIAGQAPSFYFAAYPPLTLLLPAAPRMLQLQRRFSRTSAVAWPLHLS